MLNNPPNESVHIELDFNGMIMSVCDREDQCMKGSAFWLAWSDMHRVDAYIDMNGGAKIDNKRAFGFLVASSIVQLRL